MEVSGTILRGESFEPIDGRVVIEDGVIAAVEETSRDAGDDIVVPAFVNAHTHIGDSIAKEAGRGLSLEELVAPPDGLKHQLLRTASRESKVAAMARSIEFMESTGTAAFLDFREGGVAGVETLREAAADSPVADLAYGREADEVLAVADGYGASSTSDGEFGTTRAAAREAGKPFAIHAGENDDGDINPALDLDPEFLVHMVHADELHMDRVADSETPVVVCPRSNLVTGVGLPPIADLLEHTIVGLGTDNVMLNSPSMFREMAFAAKCCDLDAVDVLRMATVNGARIAGLAGGVVESGQPARLFVLDGDSDNLAGYQDPVRAVVRRAGAADVSRVVLPAEQ